MSSREHVLSATDRVFLMCSHRFCGRGLLTRCVGVLDGPVWLKMFRTCGAPRPPFRLARSVLLVPSPFRSNSTTQRDAGSVPLRPHSTTQRDAGSVAFASLRASDPNALAFAARYANSPTLRRPFPNSTLPHQIPVRAAACADAPRSIALADGSQATPCVYLPVSCRICRR